MLRIAAQDEVDLLLAKRISPHPEPARSAESKDAVIQSSLNALR
jgi:hypothetical protein